MSRMKNVLLCGILNGVFCCGLLAQSVTPIVVTTIPSVLNESSGIEKSGPNIFWSHNDSGGQPELYRFDSSGTLLQTIGITNAVNNDWEEIAQGAAGEFYVGDFGNNNNNRSVYNGNPLTIYIVSDPDSILGGSTTAGILEFEYVDRDFAASSTNHNFDMEAFFWFNDSLHLFTKNRTSPSNGWIKHYILPAQPGNYSAMLVDSFNNRGRRITSADISPDYRTVSLLAQDRIYLFSCFSGSEFLTASNVVTLVIPNTQKEAIVFSDSHNVYLTDERTSSTVGQKLYRLNLDNFIDDTLSLYTVTDSTCFNASTGSLNVTVNGGTSPYAFLWTNGDTTFLNDSLAAGSYAVQITDSRGCSLYTTLTITSFDSMVVSTTGDTICPGGADGTVSFQLIGGEAPYYYLWSNGDTTVSADSLLYGNYQCIVTDNNGCSVSGQSAVDTFPVIFPVLIESGQYLISDYATGNSWYLNGMLLPSITNDSLLFLQNGYYQVGVTTQEGCLLFSDSVLVTTTESSGPQSLSDFHNILRHGDDFSIRNNSDERMHVAIYAINGQQIVQMELMPYEVLEWSAGNNAPYLFIWTDYA